MSDQLPVIDVSPLFGQDAAARAKTAGKIGAACRSLGFFYASGHAISPDTLEQIDAASRRFFALPEAEKMKIAMSKGGRAWRGFLRNPTNADWWSISAGDPPK